MKQLTIMIMLSVFLSQTLAPSAQASCLEGVRAAFRKPTTGMRSVGKAISDFFSSKGKAQAVKVEEILAERRARAENEARESGAPLDLEKAWDEHVRKWEDSVLDRMSEKNKKTYPELNELLALMAAKSSTFRMGLGEMLTNHGAIRFRVLSYFMERVKTVGKDPWEQGGKVSQGRRFWELWQKRIRLPARRIWTADDFNFFMAEISNIMFRVSNPEPGFATTWARAFLDIGKVDGSVKIWENFSKRFLENYRFRHKEFLEGVTNEAYGKPRPDVIRDFYRWGIKDTIFRRLATVVSRKGSKSLYDAEVQRLSMELMFFIRPVISGYFLYTLFIEPALGAWEANEDRLAFEKDVKENPDKYMPNTGQADDDRLKNFEEQIEYLTIEKRNLEAELASGGLSADDRVLRQRTLDKANRRIQNLQELKVEVQRGVSKMHP